MKKKILCVTMAAMMLFSGCVFTPDDTTAMTESDNKEFLDQFIDTETMDATTESPAETETMTDEAIETPTDTVKYKPYEQIGMDFLQDMQCSDMTTALGFLKLSEFNFVTPEDMQWVLPRTSLMGITDEQGTMILKSAELEDTDAFIYIITAECNGTEYSVDVQLCDDNSYKVLWSEAIATDAIIQIAPDMLFTVGEITADSSVLPEGTFSYCSIVYRDVECTLVKYKEYEYTYSNGTSTRVGTFAMPDDADDTPFITTLGPRVTEADIRKQIVTDAYTLYTEMFTAMAAGELTATELYELYCAPDVDMGYFEGLCINVATQPAKWDNYVTRDYTFDPVDTTKFTEENVLMFGTDTYGVIQPEEVITGTVHHYMPKLVSSNLRDFSRGFALKFTYIDGVPKFVDAMDNDDYSFTRFH